MVCRPLARLSSITIFGLSRHKVKVKGSVLHNRISTLTSFSPESIAARTCTGRPLPLRPPVSPNAWIRRPRKEKSYRLQWPTHITGKGSPFA